jgi:hypothetical protein
VYSPTGHSRDQGLTQHLSLSFPNLTRTPHDDPRVTFYWLSDVVLRRRSGQPMANSWRRCSRTRFRRPLLFLLHQLPLTVTPPTPTLAPTAPPCRRLCPAAPGPLRHRRYGALIRLAALYRPLPVDLIPAVLITRPQSENPSCCRPFGHRRPQRALPLVEVAPPRSSSSTPLHRHLVRYSRACAGLASMAMQSALA